MIHTDKQKTVRLDVGCNAFHVNITQKCYDESCVLCTLLFFWCYRDKKKNKKKTKIKQDIESRKIVCLVISFYFIVIFIVVVVGVCDFGATTTFSIQCVHNYEC